RPSGGAGGRTSPPRSVGWGGDRSGRDRDPAGGPWHGLIQPGQEAIRPEAPRGTILLAGGGAGGGGTGCRAPPPLAPRPRPPPRGGGPGRVRVGGHAPPPGAVGGARHGPGGVRCPSRSSFSEISIRLALIWRRDARLETNNRTIVIRKAKLNASTLAESPRRS